MQRYYKGNYAKIEAQVKEIVAGISLMAAQTYKASMEPAKPLKLCLWDIADALRGNEEPSEYNPLVLGQVFLNRIFDWFGVCPRSKDAMANSEEQTLKNPRYQLMTNSLTCLSIGFLILQPFDGFAQQTIAPLTTVQGYPQRKNRQYGPLEGDTAKVVVATSSSLFASMLPAGDFIFKAPYVAVTSYGQFWRRVSMPSSRLSANACNRIATYENFRGSGNCTGSENNPVGFVDLKYNSYEDQLHFETADSDLELISQIESMSISPARRKS